MTSAAEQDTEALARFNENYMCPAEMCKYVGVSRTALHFRQRKGELPGCVQLQRVLFWERDVVMPHLDEWKTSISARGVQGA